jgi:ribosomal protein L7Ae-like RNA K-turn-binding protein
LFSSALATICVARQTIVVADQRAECRDAAVVQETGTEEAAAGSTMDVFVALQKVLKTSLVHDGLARGLRESVKALDRRQAHLCVLAGNCDEPNYVALVRALCDEHEIKLIKVPESKQLGTLVLVFVFVLHFLFFVWICFQRASQTYTHTQTYTFFLKTTIDNSFAFCKY